MREFTKRQNPRQIKLKFFTGVAGLTLLALVTFGAAKAAWGMYGKFAEAAQSNEEAQQNLLALKAQEEQVGATVAALSTPRGQEAQIRQQYGVALPGEGQIHIVRQVATSAPEVAPAPSLLVKMFRALFPQ